MCPSLCVSCSEERSIGRAKTSKTRTGIKTREWTRLGFSLECLEQFLRTQSPVRVLYLHNFSWFRLPESRNSRMTPQKLMCGRSSKRPDQMSTRKSPLRMESQILGVCCGEWRKYQRRRRKAKVEAAILAIKFHNLKKELVLMATIVNFILGSVC